MTAPPGRGLDGQGAWWRRRFLTVLETLALGGRLSRGSAAARRGDVHSLRVQPGLVTARVRGARQEPHLVRIQLRPCSELAWARVEIALAEQALFTARLLAGDLPAELEEVFAQAGGLLLPRGAAELHLECDCPDWEVPCEHLAATFYQLAEALAADPFLLLRWRGRDRSALLARLRVLRSDLDDGLLAPLRASRQPGARDPVGAAAALRGLAPPVDPDAVERFWVAPVPLPERSPALPAPPDVVLRQLPTPDAALGGADLLERLKLAYAAFGET